MSNVVDMKVREAIELEASAWVIQLDGKKPTPEDLRVLREWVNRSPYHYESIHRLSTIWGELNELTSLIGEPPALPQAEPLSVAHSFTNTRTSKARFAIFALVALVAILLAPAYYLSRLDSYSATYSTNVGEQKTVALEDGSIVRINTNTVLDVAYMRNERRITIRSGEAMFEVSPDPDRPFIVVAGLSEIKAVGTAFSVRFENAVVELNVSEGKVDFAAPATETSPSASDDQPAKISRKVEALQSVTYSSGEPVIKNKEMEDMARSLAWRDGVLAFKGENLEYVVHEVSRYSNVQIVIEDPSLKDLQVGGYFGIGQIDELLVALEGSFGVQARRGEGGEIFLTRKAPA